MKGVSARCGDCESELALCSAAILVAGSTWTAVQSLTSHLNAGFSSQIGLLHGSDQREKVWNPSSAGLNCFAPTYAAEISV
jgi:hypothetical protein